MGKGNHHTKPAAPKFNSTVYTRETENPIQNSNQVQKTSKFLMIQLEQRDTDGQIYKGQTIGGKSIVLHCPSPPSPMDSLMTDISKSTENPHRLTSNPSLHFSAMVGSCDVGTHLPTVQSCWLHFPGYTASLDGTTN